MQEIPVNPEVANLALNDANPGPWAEGMLRLLGNSNTTPRQPLDTPWCTSERQGGFIFAI